MKTLRKIACAAKSKMFDRSQHKERIYYGEKLISKFLEDWEAGPFIQPDVAFQPDRIGCKARHPQKPSQGDEQVNGCERRALGRVEHCTWRFNADFLPTLLIGYSFFAITPEGYS